MSVGEIFVFLITLVLSVWFLFKWYRLLFSSWPQKRIATVKWTFTLLPPAAVAIIFFTLKVLASFDVVDNFIYILMYIFMGLAWLFLGVFLMTTLLDISWIDDAINNNNKASLLALTGGFIGLTLIYSGANIGDGPGWWCVVFAGALGLGTWFFAGIIMNFATKFSERITIDRNMDCAIRIGFYFIASGIILARASGGDWTSFMMTVYEFSAAWPLILLSVSAMFVELFYIRKEKSAEDFSAAEDSAINNTSFAVLCGIVYVAAAVASVMLLPSIL